MKVSKPDNVTTGLDYYMLHNKVTTSKEPIYFSYIFAKAVYCHTQSQSIIKRNLVVFKRFRNGGWLLKNSCQSYRYYFLRMGLI